MTGAPTILRVFIVSDLHAHCQDGDDTPSYLDTRASDTNPAAHPVAGLKHLIKTLQLKADILLCPGDLGDKAVPDAIRVAWRWINEIQLELGASQTLATAGNHDVDSRHNHNDFDARGVLQELQPLFPVIDQRDCDQFWARHYVIVENSTCRIVVLNSAAYHGNGTDEFQRGRITDVTRRGLESDLAGADDGKLNVFLCHHHPHPHAELNLGESDLMLGGQLLLQLLGSGNIGQWIVIHGHKHHPKISYGQSATSLAPVVFAAGSMSARLYSDLQANVRNQVYLLEFVLDDIRAKGIRATFRSWDWLPSNGWVPADDRSGLPYIGGFGFRENPVRLARKIADGITNISSEWREVLNSTPDLQYLTPADWRLVKNELKRVHAVNVLEADGEILRLERAT